MTGAPDRQPDLAPPSASVAICRSRQMVESSRRAVYFWCTLLWLLLPVLALGALLLGAGGFAHVVSGALALALVVGAIALVCDHGLREAMARFDEIARKSQNAADSPYLIDHALRLKTCTGETAGALARLLPRVGPEHADLFAGRHHEWFSDTLQQASRHGTPPKPAPELICSVLDAVTVVGRASILDDVCAVTRTSDTRVADAATRAAAGLRARLAAQREAATLLRPATAPDGDTLLRPAGHVETDEALLVRPAQGEEP